MSDRKLTLKSCAVRGPKGEKGDTYPGILRVSVTGVTTDESGNITGGTLSETYATIRAAVDAYRPVEMLADEGRVLHLIEIKTNTMRFQHLNIPNPGNIENGFVAIDITINSDGIRYGTYFEA